MESFTIESNRGLTFNFYGCEYADTGWLDRYCFEVSHSNVRARLVVANPPYGEDPTSLFDSMAQQWSGWQGALEWRAFKSEMQILATCDKRGHVALEFRLPSDDYGGWPEWSARFVVELEAGQLDNLARDARAFFKKR